jgi:hypothetical protein
VKPRFFSRSFVDPETYVITANLHRRHLTREKYRELIGKVIAAKPEASDREIARTLKTDHKKVGRVRKAQEATGAIAPVEKRVGLDGKARKQPAPKRWNPGGRGAAEATLAETASVGPNSAGELSRKDALIEELQAEKRRLEIRIAGLEAEIEELRDDNAELRAKLAAANDDGLDIPASLRRVPS